MVCICESYLWWEICCMYENSLKNLEQIVTVAYFHFILFGMNERIIVNRDEIGILM